jgi:hypothetical protein
MSGPTHDALYGAASVCTTHELATTIIRLPLLLRIEWFMTTEFVALSAGHVSGSFGAATAAAAAYYTLLLLLLLPHTTTSSYR